MCSGNKHDHCKENDQTKECHFDAWKEEELVKFIKPLYKYHLKLEVSEPRIIYEGNVDESKELIYFKINFGENEERNSYFFRNENEGYGKHFVSRKWYKIKDICNFPTYSQLCLELFKQGQIISITEEDLNWKVTMNIDKQFVLENSEVFCKCQENNCTNNEISIVAHFLIDKNDCYIKECTIQLLSVDVQSKIAFNFSPTNTEIFMPTEIELECELQEIPFGALFITLTTIGGWCEPTHCICTQKAIDLIKEEDKLANDKKYAEIYDSDWERYNDKDSEEPSTKHHPMVIGSHFEDQTKLPPFYQEWFGYNPKQNNYFPDYNHFGGREDGLNYDIVYEMRDWFDDWAATPDPYVDGRYFSAKNWGYGDEVVSKYNKLTFLEAIRQYNKSDYKGKRNAFLILGHVLHLLQDVGEPDHALLKYHPASALSEFQAYYEKFHICDVIFWLTFFASPDIIGAIAAAIAMNVCLDSIDINEVGYERFVKDFWKWDEEREYTIINKHDYDTFFRDLSDYSIAKTNEYGLDTPLGLDPVLGFQGINPNIDTKDNAQVNTYEKFTDEIIPPIVGYTAGFMKNFYEIVNQPPFVERVVVVIAPSGLTPQSFGEFSENLNTVNCKKIHVIYDAYWKKVNDNTRQKIVSKKLPLVPGKQAYIFIQFGPKMLSGKSKNMRGNTLKLNLVSAPDEGSVNKSVMLTVASDVTIGEYYWGSFNVSNPLNKPFSLGFEIHGFDASAHLNNRSYPGDEIDCEPATIPKVNINEAPYYPLIQYNPGIDCNHKIDIGLPIIKDQYEFNNILNNATYIKLSGNASILNRPHKILENLTLHSKYDTDCFLLDFENVVDTWDIKEFHRKHVISGLYVEFFSPNFNITVKEEYGYCFNLIIYDYNKKKYREFLNTNMVNIQPNIISDTKKLFLVIKNPDFKHQGSLRYNLKVEYSPSYGILKGELLKKLSPFNPNIPFIPTPSPIPIPIPIPTPMPINPLDGITYFDSQQLIDDLKQYVPKLIESFNLTSIEERTLKEAEILFTIAKVAEIAKLHDEAETLYLKSAGFFYEQNLSVKEVGVLLNLKKFYCANNNYTMVNIIKKRIEKLV